MENHYYLKNLFLCSLILLLATTTLYGVPGAKSANYYLGVLAEGYPHSLVISEFQYADAEIVNISDNLVLFGINENTKITTFFKNLPFLKEVYVDAESLKGNIPLETNPLAREFLFLLQSGKVQPDNPPRVKNPDSGETGQAVDRIKGSAMEKDKPGEQPGLKSSRNNIAVIDKLIREKAEKTKKNRASQATVK